MKELTAQEVVDAIECPIVNSFPEDAPVGFVIRRGDMKGRPNENKYRYFGIREQHPKGRVWKRITWPEKPSAYYDALN